MKLLWSLLNRVHAFLTFCHTYFSILSRYLFLHYAQVKNHNDPPDPLAIVLSLSSVIHTYCTLLITLFTLSYKYLPFGCVDSLSQHLVHFMSKVLYR